MHTTSAINKDFLTLAIMYDICIKIQWIYVHLELKSSCGSLLWTTKRQNLGGTIKVFGRQAENNGGDELCSQGQRSTIMVLWEDNSGVVIVVGGRRLRGSLELWWVINAGHFERWIVLLWVFGMKVTRIVVFPGFRRRRSQLRHRSTSRLWELGWAKYG